MNLLLTESFWDLVTDLSHWGQELIAETLFFIIEVYILDRLLHLHGRRRHDYPSSKKVRKSSTKRAKKASKKDQAV